MQQKIIKYIEQELASEDIEGGLDATEDLLGSGILDSLGMMKLIAFLEEEFQINVLPEDMTIENFMTVDHVGNYLESKL